MAQYEVAFVRSEVVFTRYYITVEAESAGAAMRKVEGYGTTPEEDRTIEPGKCVGMGGEGYIMEAEWAHEIKEEKAA